MSEAGKNPNFALSLEGQTDSDSDDDTIFITQTPREDYEAKDDASQDSGNDSLDLLQVVEKPEANSVRIRYQPSVEDISDVEIGENSSTLAPPNNSKNDSGICIQDSLPPESKVTEKGGVARMAGCLKRKAMQYKNKRSFKSPVDVKQLEKMKCRKYADNTTRKFNWIVESFIQWRKDCIETVGAEFCPSDILASDLNQPKLLDKRKFCNAMCKFITETQRQDGEDYAPATLKEIILGIQMYLTTEKIYWKLLNAEDEIFVDLFHVVDNEMKRRVEKGMGRVQSATPILFNQEEVMWSTGVLGESNPTQLCETVLFLIGLGFALRGGEEHKKLRRPGHNPQIVVTKDSDGYECLKYTQDPKSKTTQGGLTGRMWKPKVVHVYPNKTHPQRCLFRLYQKYVSLLPPTSKHKELYLYAKKNPKPSQWFDDRCIGINSIRTIVKRLCNLAGFTDGKFVNHSLRASTGCRLFENGVDEQLIMDTLGHKSTAVRTYKRVSDKLRRQVSEKVQRVIEGKEEKSDMSDFELEVKPASLIKKRKVSNVEIEENGAIDIARIVSKVSENKKFKKIKINFEFIESE